jgi:hypothetical protein
MAESPTPALDRRLPGDAAARFEALDAALACDLVDACPPDCRAATGLSTFADAAASGITCRAERHLYFNRLSLHSDDGEAIASAIASARARTGHGDLLVHVGRDAFDPHAAGLVRFRRDWLALARPAADVHDSAAPFRIARATRADGRGFAEIVSTGLDLPASLAPLFAALVDRPRWHVYLAFEAARPVAASALFVHERAGFLAMAATLPSHRGAGAHDALIARRARVAGALGCDVLFVETGTPVPGEPSPSLGNLVRAGFEPLLVRRNFATPGATWSWHA